MNLRAPAHLSYLVSFFAVLLIAGTFFLPTAHADLAETQAQIDQIQQNNAKLQAEIDAAQKQLTVVTGQKQTLQTAIKSIDLTRQKTVAQVTVTQNKIQTSNLQLNQLGQQIYTKAQAIDLDKQALAQSLRDLGTAEDNSLIEQLLSSNTLADSWLALDNVATLGSALRSHVEDLSQDTQALTIKKQAVAQTKDQLTSLSKDLVQQTNQLDVTKQTKAQLLVQTKAQEASYQQLIAQKKAEQASFQAALYKLSLQLKAADPNSVPVANKGILEWPLTTVVITQLFGKTTDSGRLYASGTHDGIDLGAPIGTPIHAALSGTVYAINEGAVQNCQYGKWVLIKHANGLATLYAHMSKIGVAAGQTVSTGDVIGYVGMTGYATGPHLHLTVYNASSVTLKNYTCKSGPSGLIPIAPPNGYLNPMAYL